MIKAGFDGISGHADMVFVHPVSPPLTNTRTDDMEEHCKPCKIPHSNNESHT